MRENEERVDLYRQAQWSCPLGLVVIQLVVISQVTAAGEPGVGLQLSHGIALTGVAWASKVNRAKRAAKRMVMKVVFIVKAREVVGTVIEKSEGILES